ncbi:MAG: cyclopropane-fatty-acyl-phospholipid synthase [Thiobacillus sp. SCN 64-35]|nr:class I SAM-dependent methyltransferase [Thiobacillus sp.]ODU08144.1 MAG: cyclopropane-fatty-acyl-phospholipid synthase [Thiobacillus sp. SCN 64-35]ODU89626.1 MAG: cyclopropane-fatty-acyl-phospholipid synthase [Thiobacillus sp. SCN 65-179]OJW37796.1 MAG: cyclopropane-fatty-acyl-phospholipid synthase [Thiobacillus sp. 65-69]
MLDHVLIGQVQRRVETSGLPLAITLWNGDTVGVPAERADVRIRLHRKSSLKALAHPSLGALARAYVQGALDLDGDIRDILTLGNRLCQADDCKPDTGTAGWKWWRHTRSRDRRNIQYHYDVSNDFYGLWLDAERIYSCAYFRDPGMTLEAAQRAKLDHICRKLALQPGERLLDIGCGWGGLVLHAARHYGVHAVGITLSDDQHAHASARVRELGLEGQVEVRRMDYRDVPETGTYDKIASVGMFEHVGRGHLADYFRKIHDLLKPGGLVLNHGITAAALKTQGLGGGISEFVDDYVFPGGELVHVSEVLETATTGGLECLDAENLRPHYAATLWHWVTRLEAQAARAIELIGEEKYRIWRIYMAGSAHAFERGWMELWQVLAGKAVEGRQPNYPYNRGYIYAG